MENKLRICKICGIKENENVEFHTHHIKQRSQGGNDQEENLIDICSDCHFDIHHTEKSDGNIKEFESVYKEAIDQNIFSDGWGILPKKISRDPKITAFAKILYSDISSLCAERGYCWATNDYFARVFNVNSRTISRAIQELEPYLIIRNRASGRRTIWVHQLNSNIAQQGFQQKKKKETPIKEKKITIRKSTFSESDLLLAELLLQKIVFNFPSFENKKIKIEEWAEDIRKLREIDKASAEQIEFMINWLHGGSITNGHNGQVRNFEPHDFWSKNILSAKKLRKQWFDHLVPQLQSSFKKEIKKTTVAQL